MVVLSITVAVVSALLAASSAQQTLNSVNVTTSLGTVTGLHVATGHIEYFSFRGIPYANVTTRFKAPTPMKPWVSLVMATDDGSPCAQPGLVGPLSEDCLFLNVYTPLLPKSDSPKLPVMVFIHGGGFTNGTGSSRKYGPEFLMAEKNVVLVTINYRLGIFGFLSTGTHDAQGNAGMKDQVEALRFVKNEISYFGGDPNRVTIFGVSAGGASVIYHMLSPMSKGLFHRAISQSGSPLADWTNIDLNTTLEHAILVAKNLGCDTESAKTIVKCLSEKSTLALVQASSNVMTEQAFGLQTTIPFRPVVETRFEEEVFLADHPGTALGALTGTVPLIIGANKDEGVLNLPDNDNDYAVIDRNLQHFAPREVRKHATVDQLNSFGQQLRAYYFNNGPVTQLTQEGLVNLLTDQQFMYPTAQTVRKLAGRNNTVYLYRFAYNGNYKLDPLVYNKLGYNGVLHAEEMGYLFYSKRYNNADLTKTSTNDYRTMQRMVKCWTAFAATSKPYNLTDEDIRNVQWPQVTSASELKYLNMETDFTSATDYYKERVALWDRITNFKLLHSL